APAPEPPGSEGGYGGTREFVEPILADAALPADLADALDDESFDAQIRLETDEALTLTGKDVGTPIIQFQPPAVGRRRGPAVGPRGRAGRLPGLRRAEAQPAGAAAAACLRIRAGQPGLGGSPVLGRSL